MQICKYASSKKCICGNMQVYKYKIDKYNKVPEIGRNNYKHTPPIQYSLYDSLYEGVIKISSYGGTAK